MNSLAAAPDKGPEIEFTFKDARRLWSAVCHEEKVAEMEKRLLMESAKESISEGNPKRQRKTPSIDKYVSLDNVGSKVESRFGLCKGTPVNQLLLSAIHKTLEVLDHMPVDDLIIVNRQLKGAQGIPQFRHVFKKNGNKRELVLGRVRKQCDKFILTLKEGDNLPKPFAKALSVMSLFLKHETRCPDIPTSEFFSFSSEIKALQCDIIRAIWSLPKVHFSELKGLQHIHDPEAKISEKSFRRAVKRYLMECLFECCDEVDIPPDVRRTVDIINRTSRRQVVVYSKETLEEETQAGQNVNSQLKQVALNLLQHSTIDEMALSPSSGLLESNDGSESNDFDMSYNYGSSFGECNSYTNEAEGTGDSWLPHN